MRILAIDQGTTNTKALVIDENGAVVASAARATQSHYPHPGWAEQSADEIWSATRAAIDAAVEAAGPVGVDAIAIANQRETLVCWDRRDGRPVAPAILWQCRRTAADCQALIEAGHNAQVEAATGLAINALFPAAKLAWVLREIPKARQLAEAGRLCAGTVDSWLLWNLTGGASFACDHSNASRTQLFDTRSMSWNPELARIFGASVDCLPDTLPSDSNFGVTAAGATVLPAGVPIRAMMGDSHAALYGHGLRTPGGAKATFGTGTSVMMLVPGRTASRHGLSGTIAWTDGDGTAFALEGNITVSGQAAAFMADCLGLGGAAALSELAATVGDSGGVSVVPALAGLGAPHWSDTASGLITGLTHATTQAHIARATLEAIAHQVADVVEAMAADSGTAIPVLRADGGAVTSQLLMQIQADLLGVNVSAAVVPEIGAFGAAAMAAAALGADLPLPQSAALHEPQMTSETRGGKRALWRRAVRQCLAGAA